LLTADFTANGLSTPKLTLTGGFPMVRT